MEQDQAVCCPEFNSALWDGKIHNWNNKLFLRDSVVQIFHMPLNMGSVITRMWNKVQANQAQVPAEETIMMFYDPSAWKSEAYISVSKEIPGAQMDSLSGTYISKVFDGPYQDVPVFMKEMEDYLKGMGKVAKKMYTNYAYCPKCAKKYGHNYMVIFAEV